MRVCVRGMRVCFTLAILLSVLPAAYSVEYVIGNAKVPVEKGDPDATYVGSDTCEMCHSSKYNAWSNSGHPYKLLTPGEAKAIRPDIPLPGLSGEYIWDDILYVIGGWGWKSRYIGNDGFVITKNKDGTPIEQNQYNWQDGSWSAYHPGEDKKYDCTKCHNTGSTYDRNHSNLSGMVGDWEERGIGCEACHGPGSEHVEQDGMMGAAIVVNKTAEYCGLCHVRGNDMSVIPAKGGFIRHHEQYQELKNGGMSTINCITCHDPHKAAHNGATNPEGLPGLVKKCEDCHAPVVEEFKGSIMQNAGVTCTDCHMPKVTKSAIKVSNYEADVKTHIFRINTSADAQMFTGDGKAANGYLTLEYTCLKCHTAENKTWAATYTEDIGDIHSFGKIISKVMTSGKTTVYTETKEYWVLEIEVNNNDLTNLSSVVVSDTIPEEITLDDFTASKGQVATTVKNGATKLTWTIGTMLPRDIETLVLDVSTKTEGSTQYFLEPGEYALNEGASVTGIHQTAGTITANTDPITVYAKTKTRRRRGGGGGGRGGMM